MATQNAILTNTLIVFVLFLAVMSKTVVSQNCKETGCSGLNDCCSSWGYCGTEDHCEIWCYSGHCNITNNPSPTNYHVNAGPRGTIESIVTPMIFNRTMSKVGSNCPAKDFYTHKALIAAFKSFGAYRGKVARREVAAILAHFSHGSKGFCYKEEEVKDKYCSSSKKYPCQPGKKYYGRGPLHLTRWNNFYGAAGKFLGLPLLKDPDMVARSPEVAFKFALWFWNQNVRPALQLGFGEISKRVDGRLCDNLHPDEKRNVIKQYVDLCHSFGVTPDEGGFHC